MRKTVSFFFALISFVLIVNGCSGKREDPILRLSAQEALDQGKQFLEQKKYYRAGQYLTHAFEVEPNSRSGREALLLAAEALYLNGGSDNFIRCEAKYRDFLNRFPTSDRADYAQFQIGNCLAKRAEKPDRDQKVTVKALDAYQELLRLYPTSSYTSEARQKILEVTDLLAAHEFAVGNFYARYAGGRLCQASIKRFEIVRDEYPAFSGMESTLYQLGIAYEKCRRADDAEATFTQLREKFPQSDYLTNLEKKRSKARGLSGLKGK